MMARALRISPRSYYDYKRGIYSLRERKRETLERLIQQTYAAARGRYGALRIAAEIQSAHFYVSANTVSKYMKSFCEKCFSLFAARQNSSKPDSAPVPAAPDTKRSLFVAFTPGDAATFAKLHYFCRGRPRRAQDGPD